MPADRSDIEGYYKKLFTESDLFSSPFPNLDEAVRWAKIGEYMSRIAQQRGKGCPQQPRILDVGCGRGWLTRMASVYGHCDGVDPVQASIESAQRYFPDLNFSHGTAQDVLRSPDFKSYDVVLSSEVIEHVVQKEDFVADIRQCLTPNGHVVITTPRGDQFERFKRMGFGLQPVEEWITERDLSKLFQKHGFIPVKRDRAYIDLPKMSMLHQLTADHRFARALDRLRLVWLQRGLQYLAGIYQIWWFQLRP